MKKVIQIFNSISLSNYRITLIKFPLGIVPFMCFILLSPGSFSIGGGLDIKSVYDHLKEGNTEVLNDTVRIQNIQFESGTAKLLSSDTSYLNYIANYLIRIPTAYLSLMGYTDNVGKYENNVELSRKRAESVKNYLIAHEIPRDQLHSDGRGPLNPVADNSTKEGRQQNRRVELTFSSSNLNAQSGGSGNDAKAGSGSGSTGNSGAGATAPAGNEMYRIKKTNGETIDAQFMVFREDGTIGYKVNFSGDFKKLRAAEISSISAPNGSVLYDAAKVNEISQRSEKPNVEPVVVVPVARNDAEPAFDIGSTTIGFGLGTGINYNYYGNYGFSPTFVVLFDHGIKSVSYGTIGVGGILGYRTATYRYSYGGYTAKWTNILVAVRGTYHLTVLKDKNNRFDPYVGLMAGFRINTYTDTYYDWYYSYYGYRYSNYNFNRMNVISGLFIGAKYNFARSIGVFGEIGYDISIAKFGLNINF